MNMRTSRIAVGSLASAYVRAKMQVISAGYGHEIIWQRKVQNDEPSEADFLRECAWVILNSGMREAIVRQRFPGVCNAFLEWSSAEEIVLRRSDCIAAALTSFGHKGKIEAIADCASITHGKGFALLKEDLKNDPIGTLQQFPYLGPTTSYHVAKNIGFAVAKPDRHLCRIAALSGYRNPEELCKAVADYIGDPISVVDIVLWRFATLRPDYQSSFLSTALPDA